MELREYVRACRRRWVWILVPVLLAVGAATGLTLTSPPAYRSSMVLFVTTGADDPDAQVSRLNSYIALLTGPRVAQSVIRQLDLPRTTKEVQESISAQVQEGTDLLVVSATDSSAPRSRAMVTTATAALVRLAKQLDPPSASPDGGPTPSVTVAQGPVTTRQPTNLVRNIGFSAVLGLLIGAVAVALREATRKTVNEEADLRRLGLGMVGVISLGGRSGRGGYPGEALAEAFRRLRSLLPDPSSMARDDARGASLLLTGANPKEGTTAVACGLAIAMAETGAKVVLVDANMREPGVGRYLSLDTSPGLADVLTGTASVHDVLQDSLDGRLTVLSSGNRPPDPGEVLASPALGATVRTLEDRFDVVIVDAPALHAVADAAVLGKVTGNALLVVRANHSRTTDVERSIDLLNRVGVKLAGAVLNALPRKLPTGAAWHRQTQMTAPQDAELVPGLYGGPATAAEEPDDAEQGPIDGPATVAPPVRGRARVVRATVVTDPEEEDDQQSPATRAARGQARVVVIPGATPQIGDSPAEPPNLPAQRTPDEDKRDPEDDLDDDRPGPDGKQRAGE
ncbi:MAG TPA: polysaccharide biosynthesis tyrosine autokinase [Actinoplanes sp.]|nr:polysaccharide biosynthesis tyrosine autokinase [Actinoplanes sp.]